MVVLGLYSSTCTCTYMWKERQVISISLIRFAHFVKILFSGPFSLWVGEFGDGESRGGRHNRGGD